jgi:hypothetical protein
MLYQILPEIKFQIGRNLMWDLQSKRQGNHIFFLARGCVMMRQPKTMKEDAHDKVTDRSIPFSQNPAALESPC